MNSVIQHNRKTVGFLNNSAVLLSAACIILILLLNPAAESQTNFPDKIYPRSDTWSIKCKIYRLTDQTVILIFPGHDKPSEVKRTSLSKIDFGDGKQIVFNKDGQIEGEISLPKPISVYRVLNPGLVQLQNGEELVLNGIDFSVPQDSVGHFFFQAGTEYLRSMAEGEEVTLQFDLQRRDEFGRYRAYVLLKNGTMLNAELIKRGYCRLDTGRPLMYFDDLKQLENEARQNRRGIWKQN